MMIGKVTVDIGVEQVVFTGKARGEPFERRPRSAIARVPTDLEAIEHRGIDAVERFEHPVDIRIEDVAFLDFARTIDPFPRGGAAAEFLDIRAEEGATLKHHLEAIVIGGIVAASYLDAAINILG